MVAISYLGVCGAVPLICDRKVNVKRGRECWKECVGCVGSGHNWCVRMLGTLMCVYVCDCVCEREKESDRERSDCVRCSVMSASLRPCAL